MERTEAAGQASPLAAPAPALGLVLAGSVLLALLAAWPVTGTTPRGCRAAPDPSAGRPSGVGPPAASDNPTVSEGVAG